MSVIKKLEDGINESIKNKYIIKNNLLMKITGPDKFCIVINLELLNDLVNELHTLYIHVGTIKIFKMISEEFYIKNMKVEIAKILKTCHVCQTTKYSNKSNKVPFQMITADRPRQKLSLDFYGPLPISIGGCKYIFTCIDIFSRYVHFYPIKKANATTIINKIFNHYIPTYGNIESVV